jgi:hypothetical protein
VPNLAIQYSAPPEDPNEVESFSGKGMPAADALFDKYLRALGGAPRVAARTSLVAKGTYAGFETEQAKVPVEIFSQAPAARTVIVHAPFGESVRTFDGTQAWIASADRPILLMPLTGGNLTGAKIEVLLTFPALLKQAFTQWRVARSTLGDADVYVVQGVTAGQPPLNLYFDEESGLLVRALRFVDTAIGRLPTQIDFSDYRDVDGVKMPFHWMTTWTDGQSTIELTEAKTNVAIDPAKFRRPEPARAVK